MFGGDSAIGPTAAGLHRIERNPLSDTFFSSQNIEHLQQHIRYAVWVASQQKHVIGRQDPMELLQAMRGVYLEHARHLPHRIDMQVRALNYKVVKVVTPRILSNVEMFKTYLRDIHQPISPIDLPTNVSSVGSRQIPGSRF
jgi:hypothetical protein